MQSGTTPRWGRPKEAAEHYKVGITTIYGWINADRFTHRKIDGVRLLLIGAVRGIDLDEEPPHSTLPVSQRPENAGKVFRQPGWRKRRTQKEPENDSQP